MSVYDEINEFINKPQIFENKNFNKHFNENKNSVPKELWEQYYVQFKWMFYENGTLQCRICQAAFQRFQSEIEYNEWTEPNEYSYRSFNKEDLILILKIHDFSEDHLNAINLLNSDENGIKCIKAIESDRVNEIVFHESNNNEINSHGTEEATILPIIYSAKSSVRWSQYTQCFPWLYLKYNNPGCRYCEEAFKFSAKIAASKWTDPTPSREINCNDRPNRALRRHQFSKNHKLAVEFLNENPRTEESNSYSLDKYPSTFKRERWEYLLKKYPWLFYQLGHYHCMYCEQAYEKSHILIVLETESNKYSETEKLRQFIKHQESSCHRAAKNKLQSTDYVLSSEIIEQDELENSSNTEDSFKTNIREISSDLWKKLMYKYSWCVGENGKFYGCSICQNASKPSPCSPNLNLWTMGMIPFSYRTNYEHLRKKLYSHNSNRNHVLRTNLINPMNDSNDVSCDDNGTDQSSNELWNLTNPISINKLKICLSNQINDGNYVSCDDNVTDQSSGELWNLPNQISFKKFLVENTTGITCDSTYDII